MIKIALYILLLIPFLAKAQSDDTTKYSKYPNTYGIQYPRLWAAKVLRVPTDTLSSKYGIAILGNQIAFGNGVVWSFVTGGIATVDTTSASGLRTIYRAKNDSTLFATGLLNSVKRAYDTTIRSTQNQTIFITPYQIGDIKNVRVFRNGIEIDISGYMSQEIIIAPCDLYDKIKIIQLLKQ